MQTLAPDKLFWKTFFFFFLFVDFSKTDKDTKRTHGIKFIVLLMYTNLLLGTF